MYACSADTLIRKLISRVSAIENEFRSFVSHNQREQTPKGQLDFNLPIQSMDDWQELISAATTDSEKLISHLTVEFKFHL